MIRGRTVTVQCLDGNSWTITVQCLLMSNFDYLGGIIDKYSEYILMYRFHDQL
jgi:hypothetical protein